MIDNIGGVTSQLVGLALDAALLRHQITAHNIANADTPGYSAKRLNFDDYLTRFSTSAMNASTDALLSNEVASLRKQLNQGHGLIDSIGGEVQLDQEMIELTENVLRYRALLEANGKRGDILKMAIKEGRT